MEKFPDLSKNSNDSIYSPHGKTTRQEFYALEHERSVDSVAEFLLKILEDNDSFSERILLHDDGSINIEGTEEGRSMLVQYAERMDTTSREGIFRFAKEISDKYPEITFSFNGDPEKRWVEYNVSLKK